ncbi:hypothetical protein F511_03404 [Dorcoceras hygrometricum]|uniref:Uncharacterized protein n=1 Tax=Dorcoceras hygrometricum TaxID=472368 RepID=A0A2Z7AUQ1_9LAMI|nr:hypothetical protein F511_03404 [Dorcoceras hygrometricum]
MLNLKCILTHWEVILFKLVSRCLPTVVMSNKILHKLARCWYRDPHIETYTLSHQHSAVFHLLRRINDNGSSSSFPSLDETLILKSKYSHFVHCLSCKMVKRKATEAVDLELQERTFDTNHVSLTVQVLILRSEEDGFRRSHFPGTSTVTLVDLRARIDEFEGEIGVEVDLKKIKLASLYFASVVLDPRRKRKKEVVDPHWMRLVDDMDSFNTYPWDRLPYEEVLFVFEKTSELDLKRLRI